MPHRLDQCRIHGFGIGCRPTPLYRLNRLHRQTLPRIPSIERITVVSGQKGEIFCTFVNDDFNRRREFSPNRKHGTLRQTGEFKCLLRLAQGQDLTPTSIWVDFGTSEIKILTIGPDQTDRDRQV